METDMDFDADFLGRFMKPSPIPDLLHSAYEEGPFRCCTVCGGELAKARIFEIQKVFRGKEVIFEMAICHACGEQAATEFSEESLENIRRFLTKNFRPSEEPRHCHFCGFPRNLIPNFTIVGACSNDKLVLPSMIMCEGCTERLQGELSGKTRDVQGDFLRDHFPGVPADLDLSPSFSGILG